MVAVAPLLAVALAACADQPSPATERPASSAVPHDRAAEAPEVSRSEPAWISIPAIGARSSLVPLGLNPDRTVEVPPVEQPKQAGWYEHGPAPGELGPAVILGHVNGGGLSGVFARLGDLEPGDEVYVGRQDGKVVKFVVRRMRQVSKTQFPSDEVYGNTAGPELRLITCGGSFDSVAQSYEDNVIAFADLA